MSVLCIGVSLVSLHLTFSGGKTDEAILPPTGPARIKTHSRGWKGEIWIDFHGRGCGCQLHGSSGELLSRSDSVLWHYIRATSSRSFVRLGSSSWLQLFIWRKHKQWFTGKLEVMTFCASEGSFEWFQRVWFKLQQRRDRDNTCYVPHILDKLMQMMLRCNPATCIYSLHDREHIVHAVSSTLNAQI